MTEMLLSIVLFGIIYAVHKYIDKNTELNMAFFTLREDLTSYIPTLHRLGFCALFCLLLEYRHKVFPFLNVFGDNIDLLFCCVLAYLIIISFVVSIGEIGTTFNNRRKEKLHKDWCMSSSIKTVKRIVEENDEIELKVKKKNRIVRMGSFVLINKDNTSKKKYYIRLKQYDTIDEFGAALKTLFPNNRPTIISINDEPANTTKYFAEKAKESVIDQPLDRKALK